MPGTLLQLLAYLTYLALGTVVFWLLESPVAHDSSRRFRRDKWALLQNFTCLDGPALDSLIRVRGGLGARGAGGRGWRRGAQGARAGGERASVAPVRATPGAVLQKKVEGIDAGTSGAARCQVGTKELGRTAKERARLPRAECAARPGESGVRGRKGMTRPESCVATASECRMRTTGGALTWSRAGRADTVRAA